MNIYRFIFLLALTLVLFACDKSENVESSKKEIIVKLPSHPMQSLDPTLWNVQTILGQGTLFEGLFGLDSNLDVVPKIVKNWEVSQDLMNWTFYLKSDSKWSNGDAVVAKDFIYAWRKLIAPGRLVDLWATPMPYIKGAEDYHNGGIDWESVEIKAPNDTTIKISLINSNDIRPLLANGLMVPLHQKSIEKAEKMGHDWWKPGFFVGNGPYVPTVFNLDGKIILRKNPHYPYLVGNVDQFDLVPGGFNVQIQNFEARAIDLAQIFNMGDYRFVKKLRDTTRSELIELEEFGFNGIQIARTVNPLFYNIKLRKALSFAIDRKTLSANVMGGRVLSTYAFGPPSDPLLKDVQANSYNPDSARIYLEASGYTLTRPVIYLFAPQSNDSRGWAIVAEALQAQLKEVGFNILIENTEDAVLAKYSWGHGFLSNPKFSRPGITLYTGKMLWNSSIMKMRLADHTWYYLDYPYELKAELKRKKLALESRIIEGCPHERDVWECLDEALLPLIKMDSIIQAVEPHPLYRKEMFTPNFFKAYQNLKIKSKSNGGENENYWKQARTVLADAEQKYLTYLKNKSALPALRKISQLNGMLTEESDDLVIEMQKKAIEKSWIIPLYSEKMVYIKKPWLQGEVLNRFGNWNQIFLLGNIKVDSVMYFK